MPDLGKILPVEPEDHETFCRLFGRYGPYADDVRSGSQDSDWRLQEIARHRVAPTTERD